MAWRIHDKITHGEIDNRRKGFVEGRIWLHGSDEPLILRLKGNCWSDLAGCLLTFSNPSAEKAGDLNLDPVQEGVVGDMTASRKVRVPIVSQEEVSRLTEANQPIPTQLGNCIYLEWFSGANGRVVLESPHYICQLSNREWDMTSSQEDEQRQENQENLQEFLQKLVNEQSFLDLTADEPEAPPLDEFEWEKLLRQSDQITDHYLEALEKFRDDPDCDRRVAESMGWDWLIEEGDLPPENPLFDFVKQATGEDILGSDEDDDEDDDDEDEDDFDEEEEGDEDDGEDFDEEDEELEEEHPITRNARELAIYIYRMTEERGLLKSQDATLISLLTCSNATAAKLAGALHSLASDDPDYGFAIAALKRTLPPLHQAIAAADRMAEQIPEESTWLQNGRDELFLLRQDILELMHQLRQSLGE
jgi:hypothetical protein